MIATVLEEVATETPAKVSKKTKVVEEVVAVTEEVIPPTAE